MRSVLLAAALCVACKETAKAPPAEHGAARSSTWWSGEPIAATPIAAAPITGGSDDDTWELVRTEHGVFRTRQVGDHHQVVDEAGHAIEVGEYAPDVIASEREVFLDGGRDDAQPMTRYDHGKLVPVASPMFAWVFDVRDRIVAVGNAGDASLHQNRYRTIALVADRGTEVAVGSNEYASAAVRAGDEVIIAAREHDQSLGMADSAKATAVMASIDRDDNAGLAAMVGNPTGLLVHVDATGHETRRETFTAPLPQSLAVTDAGWLVVATEGTPQRGFHDAAIVARPPGAGSAFQLLAASRDGTATLVHAGPWACYTESDDGQATAHCIDPARRVHLATAPMPGTLRVFDVEPGAKPRVILHYVANLPDGHHASFALQLP